MVSLHGNRVLRPCAATTTTPPKKKGKKKKESLPYYFIAKKVSFTYRRRVLPRGPEHTRVPAGSVTRAPCAIQCIKTEPPRHGSLQLPAEPGKGEAGGCWDLDLAEPSCTPAPGRIPDAPGTFPGPGAPWPTSFLLLSSLMVKFSRACLLSYSGGRGRRTPSSRPAWATSQVCSINKKAEEKQDVAVDRELTQPTRGPGFNPEDYKPRTKL